MEHIVDKHMIRVLRDIVMEYIDEYRIKYEHCVWELNVKILNIKQKLMMPHSPKYIFDNMPAHLYKERIYDPFWASFLHDFLCRDIQRITYYVAKIGLSNVRKNCVVIFGHNLFHTFTGPKKKMLKGYV